MLCAFNLAQETFSVILLKFMIIIIFGATVEKTPLEKCSKVTKCSCLCGIRAAHFRVILYASCVIMMMMMMILFKSVSQTDDGEDSEFVCEGDISGGLHYLITIQWLKRQITPYIHLPSCLEIINRRSICY